MSGGAPTGGYPGGAPGFYGSAADSHGAENNQCGSSFYGPAFGGGVHSQGVGAGVSQHPMLLQATLQASGMPVILERVSAMAMAQMVPIGQGMAVFFLKQSEETTGETGALSVTSGSPLPVLLWSHVLVVE